MTSLTYRHPDIPGGQVAPSFLGHFNPSVYLAHLKMDGWRGRASRRHRGRFVYRTKTGKPLVLPDRLRAKVERCFGDYADVEVDLEVTGRRREQDAEDVFLLDVMQLGPETFWEVPCVERINLCCDRFAELTAPVAYASFGLFWNHHKENTPLAEGVVLKRRDSRYHGDLKAPRKNAAWVKCKWRAGFSGETPTE